MAKTKEECYSELDEILNNPEIAVNEDIIDTCKSIINQFNVMPSIFVKSNDSISLKCTNGTAYIELEVFSDKFELFVEVNGIWALTDLLSTKQAIQWWNTLNSMS